MNATQVTEIVRNQPEVIQQAQEQLEAMLARSATDAGFRQRLLSDPRAAVSEYTGRSLPESYNVVFVENRADATIVLPEPYAADAELSESELEAVAGGLLPLLAACLTAFCMGLTSND